MTYDPARMVAFDTETHLIQPGLLAPPLVCASVAMLVDGKIEGRLCDREDAHNSFRQILQSDYVIVGANLPYDLLVMAVEAARRGEDLMPLIFAKYDRGEIFDVLVAEGLHAIACGHLGTNPDGSSFRNHKGKVTTYYGLDTVVRLVLGRSNAKVNNEWVERYHELENVPISEWPHTARTYPVDDAVNTLEVAVAQVRGRPTDHRWGPDDRCTGCGVTLTFADPPPCTAGKPNMNLHDLAAQCRADWALHLGAAWGFKVDGQALDALEAKVLAAREAGAPRWEAMGLLWRDKKGLHQDQKLTQAMIARAYGCSQPCPTCGGRCVTCLGTGRVAGARLGKTKTCTVCKGDLRPRCEPTDANPTTAGGFCYGTGLLLTDVVPRSDGGGIAYGRDALTESGDEDLIDFAAWSESAKIANVYVPKLRPGVTAPLTLFPNVLLDTGRVSYAGIIQLLPRDGGVREVIVARPGFVFVSCDYGGLELSTHGQSCLWIVGRSELARALNDGTKIHDAMGARLGGVSYEDMLVRVKAGDKLAKAWRQAAKPANFGFPGGMGAPKLVLQQRKQGPDTTAPDGTTYKGLRFCVLLRGERCGERKVTEWKNRPLSPTCVSCIECAEDIRNAWFKQWPENREYFRIVGDHADRGWVEQHVSRRIRGGVTFTSAANGYFQGLAADGAKLALYRVNRECYVDRNSYLYGSRNPLFAHDELIVEVPEDRAHEAAMRIGEIMVGAMREFVPDVVVTAEPALMRRWYKGASPKFENGRLIPWEPEVRAA